MDVTDILLNLAPFNFSNIKNLLHYFNMKAAESSLAIINDLAMSGAGVLEGEI